jgi:DNA adenine methylase
MQYDGGKNGSGVFQRLICMMPPHRLYVEAFAGSAAILRRKRPAEKSICYELNPATIRELAKHLPPDWFEPWDLNSEWVDDICLPGCGGTSIGFNEPGTSKGNLEIFLADALEMLQAKFVAGSYLYGLYDPRDVLIYADPPYPREVRSQKGRLYQYELLEEQEHGELCDLLRALPCRVMVSGYDNDLYNRKLKGWRKEQIPTTNRAGKKVIETVWLNFPVPIELHDPKHVGADFRQRWNITKRVRNWTGQLKAMDAGTRQAIVEALGDEMKTFLDAGREVDRVAMEQVARKAAAWEKKRRPVTPRSASPAAKEQPLFEDK